MTTHLAGLTRLLPLTSANAQELATRLKAPLVGRLTDVFHPLEGLSLRNAPEEEVPRLEQNYVRIALEMKGTRRTKGRLFGTFFVHPEFSRVYRNHGVFDQAPCAIELTATGFILDGRPTEYQSKEDFKPWRVELPFVDEGATTIGKRNLPMIFDPDKPQDPDFVRESLARLDTVFAQQPEQLYFSDRTSWCKPRFLDQSSISCTELLPGAWLAVQEDSGDVLLVCSAERFAPNSEVAESSIFLRSETTLAIRSFGFSGERRRSLWGLAWGDDSCQYEAEATRTLLRTLIHDRRAHGTPEDALAQPITPRPFWCERYF